MSPIVSSSLVVSSKGISWNELIECNLDGLSTYSGLLSRKSCSPASTGGRITGQCIVDLLKEIQVNPLPKYMISTSSSNYLSCTIAIDTLLVKQIRALFLFCNCDIRPSPFFFCIVNCNGYFLLGSIDNSGISICCLNALCIYCNYTGKFANSLEASIF